MAAKAPDCACREQPCWYDRTRHLELENANRHDGEGVRYAQSVLDLRGREFRLHHGLLGGVAIDGHAGEVLHTRHVTTGNGALALAERSRVDMDRRRARRRMAGELHLVIVADEKVRERILDLQGSPLTRGRDGDVIPSPLDRDLSSSIVAAEEAGGEEHERDDRLAVIAHEPSIRYRVFPILPERCTRP